MRQRQGDAIKLGAFVLIIVMMWWAVVARGDVFQFKPTPPAADRHELEIDGHLEPAVVAPCGDELCATTAPLVAPYCWDVYAVSEPHRVQSSNGPLCRSRACKCDMNGDGAVGLGDVWAAFRSSGGLAQASRCLGVLGRAC